MCIPSSSLLSPTGQRRAKSAQHKEEEEVEQEMNHFGLLSLHIPLLKLGQESVPAFVLQLLVLR